MLYFKSDEEFMNHLKKYGENSRYINCKYAKEIKQIVDNRIIIEENKKENKNKIFFNNIFCANPKNVGDYYCRIVVLRESEEGLEGKCEKFGYLIDIKFPESNKKDKK